MQVLNFKVPDQNWHELWIFDFNSVGIRRIPHLITTENTDLGTGITDLIVAFRKEAKSNHLWIFPDRENWDPNRRINSNHRPLPTSEAGQKGNRYITEIGIEGEKEKWRPYLLLIWLTDDANSAPSNLGWLRRLGNDRAWVAAAGDRVASSPPVLFRSPASPSLAAGRRFASVVLCGWLAVGNLSGPLYYGPSTPFGHSSSLDRYYTINSGPLRQVKVLIWIGPAEWT